MHNKGSHYVPFSAASGALSVDFSEASSIAIHRVLSLFSKANFKLMVSGMQSTTPIRLMIVLMTI